MSRNRVRLLPVIGIVAFGLFSVKAVSIAEAAGERAAEKAAADQASADAPSTASAPEVETVSEEVAEPAAETCPANAYIADQAGLSQYEIQVLRSLSDRRETLDAREASLDTREMTISAAENRLNDQIDELKNLEGSIQDLLGQLDQKNEEELAALVKMYESMKPKDAARIFNTMPDLLMVQLANRMKPTSAAAVLSEMDTQRALVLTTLMAQRTEPPQTVAELEARTNEP